MMADEPQHQELPPGQRWPIDVIAATLTNYGLSAGDAFWLARSIYGDLILAGCYVDNDFTRERYDRMLAWAKAKEADA